MKINHIIIGDAHDKPEISKDRFEGLGDFIAKNAVARPDELWRVIDMGDFEDMHSLSSYDKGKLSGEGSRFVHDLDSAQIARLKITERLNNINEDRRRNKKKLVNNVDFVALGGNHFEARLKRLIQDNAPLENALPSPEQIANQCGWRYTPFLVPEILEGIAYVHYWQARGTGKPLGGGKYPAQTLIREKHTSTVVGHSHVLDIAIGTSGSGQKIFAASAGCFMASDQVEDYAGQSNKDWSRGILALENVVDGFPEGGWSWIPVERFE